MKPIKYQYAKDENKKLIDINSLNKENKNQSSFYCLSCGEELIARLGKMKVHHFAHKHDVTCSKETYLHSLGKELFFNNYTGCLNNKTPFYIELYEKRTCNHHEKEFGIKCNLETKLIKHDLTQFFDTILLETKEGSFIPDIKLESKDGKEKLFIEIVVTHSSTEEKLNSNYRIIEIKAEREEDFEPIKNKLLSAKNPMIMFKNFAQKDKSFCNGDCQANHYLLTLNKEGRVLSFENNLKQIKRRLSLDKNIIKHQIITDGFNFFDAFKKGVLSFAKQNLKVRNCFICRYHAENDLFEDIYGVHTNKPIFCKFLKKDFGSNSAVTCKYFKTDKKCLRLFSDTLYNDYYKNRFA